MDPTILHKGAFHLFNIMSVCISVVIPAYNAESYLVSCIESILAQKFTDFEAIIINDCSTDGTAELIDYYGSLDGRIKPVHQKDNRGPGRARNTGIVLAQGEFVYTVDADDLVAPGAFEKLVTVAKEDDVDVVFAAGMGWRNGSPYKIKKLENNAEYRKIPYIQFPHLRYGCTWRYFYKRSLLEKHNIRFQAGLVMGDDVVFNARVLPKANRISIIKDVIYYYRQDGNGMCSQAFDLKLYKDCIIDAPRYGYLALDEYPTIQQWFLHRHLLRRICYRLPQALKKYRGKEADRILTDFIRLGENIDANFSNNHDHRRRLAQELPVYPLPLSLYENLQDIKIPFALKKMIVGIMPEGEFTWSYLTLGVFIVSLLILPFGGHWLFSGILCGTYLFSLWRISQSLKEFLEFIRLFPGAFVRFTYGVFRLFAPSSILRYIRLSL